MMKSNAKLVDRNVSPKFEHDCECCRFVGRLDGKDLYACKRPEGMNFIVRFGDEPHQNGSLGHWTPSGTPYALAAVLVRRGGPPAEYVTR